MTTNLLRSLLGGSPEGTEIRVRIEGEDCRFTIESIEYVQTESELPVVLNIHVAPEDE